MKSILRRISAIIRSAMAGVAHAVLVPIHLADGALGYVWRAVTGGAPAMSVEDVEDVAVNETAGAKSAPTDADRHREIGLAIKAQACALLEHKKIPMDVPGCWLRTLSKPAIAAILAADPVTVGRHFCGVEQMKTEYEIRIPYPRPDEDKKAVAALFEERRRVVLRADDRRVKRERQAAPSIIPSLAPGF